ncbi:hypothetical protein [Neisseria sicca]|nr:hypothetical protein [Neisseria sicca]
MDCRPYPQKLLAELKAEGCNSQEVLRRAKRRVVSTNGGTAAQWHAV